MTDSQHAKIAKISYRLNVGRTDGENIALGVLVLFEPEPGAKLLVLMTKNKLDDAHLTKMDWIARETLASPDEFFKREIDAASAANVPDIFTHLSQKFSWSLYVAPAVDVLIPSELAQGVLAALASLSATTKQTASRPTGKRSKVKIIEIRSHHFAASALAKIAGPEFPPESLVAMAPPAWMIGYSFGNPISR